jgi:hypothetical protein
MLAPPPAGKTSNCTSSCCLALLYFCLVIWAAAGGGGGGACGGGGQRLCGTFMRHRRSPTLHMTDDNRTANAVTASTHDSSGAVIRAPCAHLHPANAASGGQV